MFYYNAAIVSSGKATRLQALLGTDLSKCMAPLNGEPALKHQLHYWATRTCRPQQLAIIAHSLHMRAIRAYALKHAKGLNLVLIEHDEQDGSYSALCSLPGHFIHSPLSAQWGDLIMQSDITMGDEDAIGLQSKDYRFMYNTRTGTLSKQEAGNVPGVYYFSKWARTRRLLDKLPGADLADRLAQLPAHSLRGQEVQVLDFGDIQKHASAQEVLWHA